jgi:hypothetical protein
MLIRLRFIGSPPSFYDIDTQKLVKILGYHDEFVKFSSYKKRGGNPGVI